VSDNLPILPDTGLVNASQDETVVAQVATICW